MTEKDMLFSEIVERIIVSVRRMYTSEEKLAYMLDKHPQTIDLIKEFDLEIDY